MQLFLIRHGETVDNVASVYAGSRDSALTAHGALQCQRLGSHLADRTRDDNDVHFFSSDLQRAAKTAQAICDARGKDEEVRRLTELREKHFGSGEGIKFGSGQDRDPHDGAETNEDMRKRVDSFLKDHLLPLLTPSDSNSPRVIIVVAHGIILGALFRRLCEHLSHDAVAVKPEAQRNHRPFSSIGGVYLLPPWSNTAYLELDLTVVLPRDWSCVHLDIVRVNCVDHLQGLRKTRGGIGSARFDDKQKTINSFFAPSTKQELADAP